MARTITRKTDSGRALPSRTSGRASATSAKAPAKTARSPAKPKQGEAITAPRLSMGELRVEVEKLERANANLRTKSREANRHAKAAAARITELEAVVERLEKRLSRSLPTKLQQKPTRRARIAQTATVEPNETVPLDGAADVSTGSAEAVSVREETFEEASGGSSK